jgi:predicted trehalose synthase
VESMIKVKKFHKYPYYTYENEMYSSFVISFMNSLEPSFYMKNEIIAKELDESLEVLFVDKGRYEIGYEINKK